MDELTMLFHGKIPSSQRHLVQTCSIHQHCTLLVPPVGSLAGHLEKGAL